MRRAIPIAVLALLVGCETIPTDVSAPSPAANISSAPLDLGDWRRASVSTMAQHFEREIAGRYQIGLPLTAVSSDLRRNEFACAENRDSAGRGDPPDQICRKAVAAENCTHTWQVHLYDADANNALARTRALYDRRCGGDGLLGGPG